MRTHVTETIFDGKTVVIPLSSVQHVERYDKGINIVTDKTRWNFEHDCYENAIYLNKTEGRYQGDAEAFMKAWTDYIAEKDGMLEGPHGMKEGAE